MNAIIMFVNLGVNMALFLARDLEDSDIALLERLHLKFQGGPNPPAEEDLEALTILLEKKSISIHDNPVINDDIRLCVVTGAR